MYSAFVPATTAVQLLLPLSCVENEESRLNDLLFLLMWAPAGFLFLTASEGKVTGFISMTYTRSRAGMHCMVGNLHVKVGGALQGKYPVR